MVVAFSDDFFQYWRQALNPDLLAEVDLANSQTPGEPWRVRFHINMERLRWWHWRKTTVTRYQVLKHLEGNKYELIDLRGQSWTDRVTVLQYFRQYNSAGPGPLIS